MITVGFEPTPLRTGAWSQRLSPFGRNALGQACAHVCGMRFASRRFFFAQAHATHAQRMVPRGLEPRTLRLLAVRSNQLSYETIVHMAVCRKFLPYVFAGLRCVLAVQHNRRGCFRGRPLKNKKIAPREARTPDLEVNGLTL